MEIIPISESKLKIMLTPDDMAEYAISEEALSYEKKDVRTLFSGILDEVKKVTHNDIVYILENLDRELVKGAIAGPKFREYFFANCKCDKMAEYIKSIL